MPGAQTDATTELDPGRYVAICFVPVGATPEALASGATLDEEDGHFVHGMVAEFEVAPRACAAVPPPRRTLASVRGCRTPKVRRDRNRGVARWPMGVR
jgi:hypothetical protein